MITQQLLKSRYLYDPNTGLMTNRHALSPKAVKGAIAGCIENNGYRTVRINKRQYTITHIIWLYVFGRLPDKHIDHINGVRDDNRLCNLRDVSISVNTHNKPLLYRGTKRVPSGKYTAVIKRENKQIYLGTYTTEEAHRAYLNAKQPLTFR